MKSNYCLDRLHADGPFVLTCIDPDSKGIETKTFATLADADAFCEKWDGKRNLYWSVNPPRADAPRDKKLRATDIDRVVWLHLDLDPRAGENIAEEQERIRGVIESMEQQPTLVTFTGGGYQCFWKLREPIVLDGTNECAANAARRNRWLETEYKADHCHNIDRIMRIPNTWNLPDARKRKKGRERTLGELYDYNSTRVYDADEFPEVAASGPSERAPVVLDNVPTEVNVDDLRISDRLKVIAVHGRHTEEPKDGDNSRSAWVFDFVCNAVRERLDDATIFAILTDKRLGISESILQKGSNARAYAERQIENAKKQVADDTIWLHPTIPVDSATKFVALRHPTLIHTNDDWLEHDGAAYVEREDATIRASLYKFLASAKISDDKPQPFNPTKAKVANVHDALTSVAHRPRDTYMPPCWLDGDGPPPDEIVACQNGLLHLPTGRLHPPTSKFFTRNALEFDYNADAPSPERWLQFLGELWPRDSESIDVLQEMFGYLLIPDTSQQKIFMLVGPPRSGKGTIARVLTRLIGRQNGCAPTLKTMNDSFGLETLVGKQLATISDVRLGPKTDHAALAENLLRISGEDMVTVARKYKRDWNGQLAIRFLLMTNVLPRFADPSGALANRFVPLIMHESFLNRENPRLFDELLVDLPGILNWSIAGWRRLQERGHFRLPGSSADTVQQLVDLASPEAAFIRDECVLQPAAVTPKQELFGAWQRWCDNNGDVFSGTLEVFSTRLMAAANGCVSVTKPRVDGKRVPSYRGIGLSDENKPEHIPF